ncbi:MAG TPA: 4Fe-4S dicluster domain-containing protein [Ignavibacteriaceae bacterium]|nr:4Fe-4S dicluster domain-containing protein [Ignavibacteriaceae bacterium]
MNKAEIIDKIRYSGVVGAGGGGFPTYKKLQGKVEHIIANGVECEPLLYKDREVMLRETAKLIDGLLITKEVTGADKITIAIKRKNSDLVEIIKPIADKKGMDIFIMDNVYPAGDEYILVYDITGKRIPPNGIPLMVGCLVDNVETLINISNAVNNEPVTEKFVTITGAVKNPVTTSVPVGTSYRDCIEITGGFTVSDPVILTGGVMMGGVETNLSKPVSRTLGGLIVLPEEHSLVIRKTTPRKSYNKIGHSTCDQCSFCTQVCPRYILGYPIQPHLVMRSLQMTGDEKERLNLWASSCCECNICSLFACPEKLDPKNICADTKRLLNEEKKGFTKEEIEKVFNDVHPARDGREIPISILYQRLGLKLYDRKAEWVDFNKRVKDVFIPLTNNFGNAAVSSVEKGAVVKKGDLIGIISENETGVPAHSSIDGTVKSITADGILVTSI